MKSTPDNAPAAPMVPTDDVPVCAVCGGLEWRVAATGRDYELGTCANEWRMVECVGCAHMWLHPRPAISALPIVYPSTYYAYNYETTISPIAQRGKAWMDQRKLGAIVAAVGRPVQAYADVGCGTGRYLRLMAERGVSRSAIYGQELNDAVVAGLKAEGFQACACRAEACPHVPEGSLDLVTIFHVIEHVSDPRGVVRRLASWLKPGGVLALETPNVRALDRRLFHRTYWGGYHYPRHWHLFHRETLSRLLAEEGLEVEWHQYQTGHAFWMYSVHHWLKYGCGMPRLARWFDPFKGVPFLIAFTAFDRLRGLFGIPTSAMLLVARKRTSTDRP